MNRALMDALADELVSRRISDPIENKRTNPDPLDLVVRMTADRRGFRAWLTGTRFALLVMILFTFVDLVAGVLFAQGLI